MLKKKWTKALALGLAGALAVGCMAMVGCSGSDSGSSSQQSADYTLVEDGKLTVLTSADYPPMEYMEGNEIKGFDPELIREVGNRLGLEVEIKNQAFDSLVTAISGGTSADVAISAISIDDERAKEIDYTESYYDSNLAIVVLKDSSAKDKSEFNSSDIKVGAQSGTSGESWAKENLKKADYTPFQETPDLLAALRTGKIDVAIYDDPVAQEHVTGEYDDCKVLETIATGEQYGIIVNQDNKALTEAINKALAEMEEDGTLSKLMMDNLG